MIYIQLIEKVLLEKSVILTMWDLQRQARLTVEIIGAPDHYVIGSVFSLDRSGQTEFEALKPVAQLPSGVNPLMPMPAFSAGQSMMYRQSTGLLGSKDAAKPTASVNFIAG